MKNMKNNSPLKDLCPEKTDLTNHSARKTVVKKLKSSGIPKCEIKNITDHASSTGFDDYTTQLETNERSRSFHGPLTTVVLFLQEAQSTLSCKFNCIFVGRPCLQFHSLQRRKSTSDIRRGYKRIVIEESD